MIKRLHHLGIVVKNIEESVSLYTRILGEQPLFIKDVPGQRGRVALFKIADGVEIELMEPTPQNRDTARFLENRGEGIHHIGFEVDDVDKDLMELADKGLKVIDREGYHGLTGKIGFLHPKSASGVLIELVQPES